MAKRSPILGYNHNVRYRGLVFHVQTEDSGVLSPHLFTHLFYTGVIVSTRKLVYDAGSAEDAIKSLMQAQHKAVLKDLRRGVFDDKIDAYLGGTPGLLPRGADVGRDSEPVLLQPAAPDVSDRTIETARADLSELQLDDDDDHRKGDVRDPTLRDVRPTVARATTAERKSPPSTVRSSLSDPPPPPASDEIDGPTDLDKAGTVAAAVVSNQTVRTPAAEDEERQSDSQPEIEIQLELDEPEEPPAPPRGRIPRDTALELPRGAHLDEHTRPTIDVSALSDGIPGILAAAAQTPKPRSAEPPPVPGTLPNARPPSAVGAAALPPARPITRPPQRPAMTPPQVLARPLEGRGRDSDAVEVYAPAPPSADAPPGVADRSGERPGTYAQHRRSGKMPPLAEMPPPLPRTPERPATAPATPPVVPPPRPRAEEPPRATRPASQQPVPNPRPPVRDPVPARESQPIPTVRPTVEPTLPLRSRTTTPSRASGTQPASSPSGGVVMTRPAVIVGAPAKPTQPRVRKAREDEGRGFGQGLISEKSLDEVILAYLSEDAEDNK